MLCCFPFRILKKIVNDINDFLLATQRYVGSNASPHTIPSSPQHCSPFLLPNVPLNRFCVILWDWLLKRLQGEGIGNFSLFVWGSLKTTSLFSFDILLFSK
jgi:hypothetical protein